MTKILLAVLLLLFGVNTGFSQEKDKTKDQLQGGPCCGYINIVSGVTNDCCALIKINDPYCTFDRSILFDYLDPNTGLYVNSATVNSTATYVEQKICPPTPGGKLTIRIRFAEASTGHPRCIGYPDPQDWKEGWTQYTLNIDLSTCCKCPPAGNNWLDAIANPDPSCAPGCKVQYKLNIPDSVKCFKYYMIEDGAAGIPAQTWEMATHPISMVSGCLQPGQSSHVTVALLTSPNGAPCMLTDSVTCQADTTIDTTKPKPCQPDCFNSLWEAQEPLKLVLGDCPNCRITVEYVTRKACGHWQDLQITAIKVPNTPGCSGCNIESIYKQAVAGAIIKNAMGFEPKNPPDCSTIWRIASGSCWANWKYYIIRRLDTASSGGAGGGAGTGGGGSSLPGIYYLDSVIVWEPCEGSHCCLQPMKVCKLAPNTIEMSIDSTYPNYFNCNTAWTLNQWGDTVRCQPACDWNANLAGVTSVSLGKEGVENEAKTEDMLGIKAEFIQETLVIRTRSPFAIDAAVTIYDLQGKPIIKRPFKIFTGESTTNVKTNDLNSGAYLYSITIGDSQINSGKFVIVK